MRAVSERAGELVEATEWRGEPELLEQPAGRCRYRTPGTITGITMGLGIGVVWRCARREQRRTSSLSHPKGSHRCVVTPTILPTIRYSLQ